MLEDPTKDDATLRRGAPQVPPPTAFEDLALPPSDTAPIERPQARPPTRDPFEDVAPPLKFDRPPPLVQPPAIQKGAGQTQVLAAMSPPAEIAEPRRPAGGLGSTTPLAPPPQGLGTTMPLPQQPQQQPPPAPLHGLGSTAPLTQLPSIPPAPQIQEMRSPAAPLLVDVTPLSLSVETVGGYCDVIIARNTPVPCDRTRVFVTAKNYQRVVKIRVAQGESARFGDNVQLGELELSGLREGLRGDVEIVVTFEIDSDGILQVRAKDSGTGHEAKAQLRLKGLEGSQSPESMRARQARQVVV
jgi:molecular chaperone DnaK